MEQIPAPNRRHRRLRRLDDALLAAEDTLYHVGRSLTAKEIAAFSRRVGMLTEGDPGLDSKRVEAALERVLRQGDPRFIRVGSADYDLTDRHRYALDYAEVRAAFPMHTPVELAARGWPLPHHAPLPADEAPAPHSDPSALPGSVVAGHTAAADSFRSPERQHELKTWPGAFEAVRVGAKNYEIRKDDRDFQVGDVLFLREYVVAEDRYTGRTLRVRVTYKTEGGSFGLQRDLCVMAITRL